MHVWHPKHQLIDTISPEIAVDPQNGFTDSDIETEPQFFGADCDFAIERGSSITSMFLEKLYHVVGEHVWNGVFDSRVHMLMPGMLPCIGGWHLDNIKRENGQPQITKPLSSQIHYLCCIGGCSTTQFLAEPFEWNDPINDYGAASSEIRRQELDTVSAKSGEIIQFGDSDWHRGRPAKYRGWRWFGRLTLNSNRSIENKIRTQTQVYLKDLEGGW